MAEYIEREAALASIRHEDPHFVYAIERIPAADVAPGRDFRDCRNELCLMCGQYKRKHLGACNDCRWRDG